MADQLIRTEHLTNNEYTVLTKLAGQYLCIPGNIESIHAGAPSTLTEAELHTVVSNCYQSR